MKLFCDNTNYILRKAILQSWRVKKYSYKNVARLDYGFLYVISGRITYTFDNEEIRLSAGDIIFLPKGSNYEAEFDISNGEVKNYLINFDVEKERIETSKKPFLFCKDVAGSLEIYFKNVVESFADKDHPFLTLSNFYLLLHTLAVVSGRQNKAMEDAYIKKGAELLCNSFDMSVEDVARALHLSRSAFQKRFKESYGLSPVRYRTEKRLERARHYLDTTDMPIKEIAERLTFYDLSYFYKTFEKRFGMPPKKYRENLKKYL